MVTHAHPSPDRLFFTNLHPVPEASSLYRLYRMVGLENIRPKGYDAFDLSRHRKA